ncbi:hypothetical protein GCM10011613_23290 [Cellvibrio zantedeschiae]|uniref:Peptidase M48 domain-containing protein n=1 Tax=Cellvibrio zantedeschiae TaxID=1237077 RepID=A0ABQ3B6L1_9GAMM|nr:M48 family metallopeptidase [Cellvibrio zantedeschiae]GGY78044.1 hypothetical protein GCM10011613_23290 [Cellvibrio zantedeschiae]
MDSKLVGVFLLALVSVMASAQEYTATFNPGYKPELSSDEGGFWYQVDKLEESIKVSPDRITDPALNNYVKNVTCKLAGEYCPYIRVYILRNPHFNAGMYPNGMMHVWSGLLLRTTSEAELAAVLSHEIAHFLRSHQITQWRKLRANASAAVFADMFLTMGLATLGVVQGAMSFSRTQETEADLYGLQLMVKAGYTPEKASELWEYVYNETKNDKSKEKESVFFASHPKSADRMTILAKKAQELRDTGRQYETKQSEYVANIIPYYFDFMSNHLELQDLGRTQVMLERQSAAGFPSADIAFFYGELAKLQTDNDAIAIEQYKKSISFPLHPAAAYRELGYLLTKSNSPDAKNYLEHYLAVAPNATDKDMVQYYIESVNK